MPAARATAATITPPVTARNSLRRKSISAAAVTTARTAAAPALATTGTMIATMMEPGSASSMRRTRGVRGTCPIIQNPPARIAKVASPMARIASTTGTSSSSTPIGPPGGEAARDCSSDDVPAAGDEYREEQRDDTGDGPGQGSARAAPQRHQQDTEKDGHDQIES